MDAKKRASMEKEINFIHLQLSIHHGLVLEKKALGLVFFFRVARLIVSYP